MQSRAPTREQSKLEPELRIRCLQQLNDKSIFGSEMVFSRDLKHIDLHFCISSTIVTCSLLLVLKMSHFLHNPLCDQRNSMSPICAVSLLSTFGTAISQKSVAKATIHAMKPSPVHPVTKVSTLRWNNTCWSSS